CASFRSLAGGQQGAARALWWRRPVIRTTLQEGHSTGCGLQPGEAFHHIDHPVVWGAAMSHIPHLINGERVAGQGRTAVGFSPSTGQAARQVALADRATVRQAIDAAQAAFPAWRNTPPAKRAQLLFRFRNLLEQHKDSIIRLISEEHGKTLEDAAGELQRGIENVEYACGAPNLLKGEYSRNVGPDIDAWSDHFP